MIPIHVRTKRENTGAYLPNPVELSIRGKVLEDGEEADQETEKHSEPHETPPIFESPKGLNCYKEDDQVGDEEQELHARTVGGRSAMKKPLAAHHEGKRSEGREKRRKNNLFFFPEVYPQGPGEKEQSSAGLKDSSRPIFHASVRRHPKDDQRADSGSQELHGLECSVASGTRATSSTQMVPFILFSS